MKIDRTEVEHVAKLARLKLAESDLNKLTGQLNNILDYIDKLNELDTENIEPLAHAQPLVNIFRNDELHQSLDPESANANAPEKEKTFFQVPKVI